MSAKKRRGKSAPDKEWIVTMDVELRGVSAFVTAPTEEEAMQKAASMDWNEMDLTCGEIVNWKARDAEENT